MQLGMQVLDIYNGAISLYLSEQISNAGCSVFVRCHTKLTCVIDSYIIWHSRPHYDSVLAAVLITKACFNSICRSMLYCLYNCQSVRPTRLICPVLL